MKVINHLGGYEMLPRKILNFDLQRVRLSNI